MRWMRAMTPTTRAATCCNVKWRTRGRQRAPYCGVERRGALKTDQGPFRSSHRKRRPLQRARREDVSRIVSREGCAEMTHQGVSSEPWERHTSLHRGEESIAGSSGRLSLAVTGGDPPRPGETPPLQSSHEGATGADIVRIGGVDIYIPACKRPCKRPCPEPGGRAMAATVDRDARAPPSVASISSSNSSNGGGGGEREFHVPATSELHRFNSIASTAVGGAGRGGKSRPRSPCGEGSPELLVGMAGKREGDGGVKAARAIPSNELLGSRGLAPLSKPRLRQMHLDAGQRGFGPAPCPRCGMVYTKGVPEDEALHRTYHDRAVKGLRVTLPGWARSSATPRPDGTSILVVSPTDAAARKGGQLARLLQSVAGVRASEPDTWFVIRGRASGTVDGVLGFQRCRRGAPVRVLRLEGSAAEPAGPRASAACHGETEGEQGAGQGPGSLGGVGDVRPRRPVLVVTLLWVAGVAATDECVLGPVHEALLDVAAASAVISYRAQPAEVAFSPALRALGRQFARKHGLPCALEMDAQSGAP